MTTDVNNLVFLGFNSRVAALDQDTGQLVWQWRATTPRSGGYVSLLLLNATRLIASVNGYTYCLDPRTGEQLWYNELSGFGTGVTSIATIGKNNPRDLLLAAAAADAARGCSECREFVSGDGLSGRCERVIGMTTEQAATTPKRKRRWLRFSLRWRMSIVLVVSLPLGWFGTKIRSQREAVRAIRERGGMVLHDYNRLADPRPSGFKWLWNLLGDDLFFDVSVVNLDDLPVTDAELLYLRPLKHIRYLHLSNCKITR